MGSSALKRLAVAIIALPILYLLIRFGTPRAFFLIVLAVVLVGQYEFYRMAFPARTLGPEGRLGILLGALVVLAFFTSRIDAAFLLTMLVISALVFRLFAAGVERAMTESATLLLGVVYVAWLGGHLVWLRRFPEGTGWILFLLAVTWIGDAAAYYVGSAMGRFRLAPSISPNKTIEGAIGGLIAASVGGALWIALFGNPLGLLEGGAVGLFLGLLGAVGDLAESRIKRSAGIKDSGALFPGHGGLLDKIDSLLFTAPGFFYYLWIVKGYRFIG